MLSSLYSGISGLLTNSESINVIGNNISNVNTVGYKSQSTSFQDMLYQSIASASGTSQVGRGSTLAAVSTSFSQGSFETTTSSTDLAIGGTGFFMVKQASSDTTYYTRAGGFSFDSNGNLCNSSGYVLQGKAIDRTTGTATGVDTNINVSSAPSEPKATGMIGMVANLQSDADWAGTITQPVTGGNVTMVENSTGEYPMVGNYTVATSLNAAASITGTGSSDVTVPMGGTLTINGVDIDLTTATDLATLVSVINAQTTATKVTASATGGALTLTSTTNGTDIVVDDSSVSTGNIGWSDSDIASDSLYGAAMTMTVDRMLNGVSQGTTTYTDKIMASGGTVTDCGGSGLDVTNGAITAAGSQTFTIDGFSPTTQSSTVTPSTTSDYSSSVTVYDSLGQSHVVNVYFRKSYTTNSNESVWEWHAQLDASDSATGADIDVQAGYLTFNDSGTLISGGDAVTVSFDFANGASQNQEVQLVFGSGSGGGTTTQYPISSTTDYQTQDGYAPGTLTSVSVSTAGIISGTYSNGQIIDLYQITLASFNDPQGLTRAGGNLYSSTEDSGPAYTNAAGEGGLGSINSNSLEQSNVDLATEFVKMIVAERGYQASSKVITTTDEMLQELMQIKR
jgi:flagellar hook protein FlgE